MKTFYKNIIKCILFIALIIATLAVIFRVFSWKNATDNGLNIVGHFYETPEDTIDVLFLGSSHCFCTINNSILWEEAGIPSYNLGTGSQNLGNTYYFLKSALETQSPKLVVVEALFTAQSGFDNEGWMYRNSLMMKWGEGYVDNITYLQNLLGLNDTQAAELILKLPILHSRYNDLTRLDFDDVAYYNRGYLARYQTTAFETPEACTWDVKAPMADEAKYYIDQIVALCQENDIELLFYVAPFIIEKPQQEILNSSEEYINSLGYECIDFNKQYQNAGFDYSTDMMETSHTNVDGARKITKYLLSYMKAHYDLPDRRGEGEKYTLWDIDARAFSHLEKNNKFVGVASTEELYSLYADDDYTIIITSLNSSAFNYSTEKFDISIDNSLSEGVWVYNNGWQTSDDGVLKLSSDANLSVNQKRGRVYITGQEGLLITPSGTYITVYDNLLQEVVGTLYW